MLTYVLVGLVVAVVVLVIVVSRRPSEFRVSRLATINAPPETVFALVNDFHNWQEWSPWAKRNPSATAHYEGPDAGEGAKFAWAGNKEVGEGRMLITESAPHRLIIIRLEFLKPFKATNTAEFKFEPVSESTGVTWSMFGKNNLVGKVFSLIVDCDKMVGNDFEQGLANMRRCAESGQLAAQP